jgi:hypothetical protein
MLRGGEVLSNVCMLCSDKQQAGQSVRSRRGVVLSNGGSNSRVKKTAGGGVRLKGHLTLIGLRVLLERKRIDLFSRTHASSRCWGMPRY